MESVKVKPRLRFYKARYIYLTIEVGLVWLEREKESQNSWVTTAVFAMLFQIAERLARKAFYSFTSESLVWPDRARTRNLLYIHIYRLRCQTLKHYAISSGKRSRQRRLQRRMIQNVCIVNDGWKLIVGHAIDARLLTVNSCMSRMNTQHNRAKVKSPQTWIAGL